MRHLLVFFWFCFIAAPPAFAKPIGVKVVANASVQSTSLNTSQLRSIFSKRQSNWPNGQPIKVAVFISDSDLHQTFCKEVLKMFPYQVERIWNKLTYSGLGDLPVLVTTEKEMLEFVKSQPGAIGYMWSSSADEKAQIIEVVKE